MTVADPVSSHASPVFLSVFPREPSTASTTDGRNHQGKSQSIEEKIARDVFALIHKFVTEHVLVDWVNKESQVPRLTEWADRILPDLIVRRTQELFPGHTITFSARDKILWQRIAIDALGRQRTKYLLKYVQMWPASLGAVLDLKEYIRDPEAKRFVAQSFITTLTQRMLHAGLLTSELLGIYVNTVHVFKTLDPRGVLLDKVARSIRDYLRERDDTVKVIAASFLADVDTTSDDVCRDVARAVAESDDLNARSAVQSLDYADMEWMPDPIDAGPDFRKNDSDDIISCMLTLFEQDSFIKEVQSILGEQLLRSEGSSLEKEIRLVELSKSRLGQDKMQTCEVMLKDISESAQMMRRLKRPQSRSAQSVLQKDSSKAVPEDLQEANFYVQVLSSFFWPALREEDFSIPAPISALERTYDADFERLKSQRKLRWLHALGRATVELVLTDRTLTFEGVHTWQASVIYAFDDGEAGDSDAPATRTADELAESLDMDELLVRNALNFWTSNRVLTTSDNETYTVLEVLPQAGFDADADIDDSSYFDRASGEGQAQTIPMHDDEPIAAVLSADAVMKENKEMYESFLIGMLTNGGAMDPARAAMMLSMVVPGGFPGGVEEVRELCEGLVRDGKVVDVGAGAFGIKK